MIVLFALPGIANKPKALEIRENREIDRPKVQPVTTNLGINCKRGAYDITSDSNNVVHIVWWDNDGYLHYGNIVGNAVVNEEVIPYSNDVKINFIRPRIMARPDGASIHLTWMNPKPGTKLVHVWKDSSGWHREIVWTGNYISVPVGVADLTGKMHIIGQLWETKGGFYSKIKYWYKEPGGRYNNGWTLVEGPIKWRDTAMAIDKEGGIHGVFKSGRDPGKYVYCPNGGSLADAEVIDIPIARNGVCVSFGDLFVDKSLNVHHAFMTYNDHTIDYSVKPAGSNKWNTPLPVSKGALVLCHIENYDNAWPGIAVDTDGRVYVAWADMPCPDTVANRITLATLEPGAAEFEREVITLEADIDFDSKPALTATDEGFFLVYRDWLYDLQLYSISSKEVYISNLSENQKICAGDYSGGILTIEVNVTNPSAISRVEFYIDGTEVAELTSALYQYDWDLNDVNPGTHEVKVIGYKDTGETVESVVNVDIDCPPVVNFVNFFDGSTIAETVDVVVDVVDDKDAVDNVEFYVDNDYKYSDSTEPYEFRWDPTNLTLGNHTLSVIAYDESGLTTERSITVKYWPIFPPLDFSVSKKINRTLFIIEYYCHLTWNPNPRNNQVDVVGYRIYRVIDNVKSDTPLAEVEASTLEWDHRQVSKDEEYNYVITSVDSEGNESSGVVATAQ